MIRIGRIGIAAATLAAAGALAACGSDTEATYETADVETVENQAFTVVPVPVDTMTVTLDPEQQARRDQLDQAGYYRDVRGLEDQYLVEVEAAPIPPSAGNTTSAGAAGGGNAMAGTAGGRVDTATMSFEQLDRNGDDRLSVAEFAIYAVGLDPTRPTPNDETMPYADSEQLNRAADGFFHYDTNGDTYLQEDEFAAARGGPAA